MLTANILDCRWKHQNDKINGIEKWAESEWIKSIKTHQKEKKTKTMVSGGTDDLRRKNSKPKFEVK